MDTHNLLICHAHPRQEPLQTHTALSTQLARSVVLGGGVILLRAERKGFDRGGLRSSDTESTILEPRLGHSEQTSALQGILVL